MAEHADGEPVEIFAGEIKVAATIIDYISSGLYKSPAACLKELVNNSHDAAATKVEIFVKPDADRIIIADNGEGMSRAQFEAHFQNISDSVKRDSGDRTSNGRPKIGKIGIGFVAANEICEIMEIFSTKKGSKELLHATIDFSELKKPAKERRRGTAVHKGDYKGEILSEDFGKHYTRIFLTKVKGDAKNILSSARPQNEKGIVYSIYGKSLNSIREIIKNENIKSWKDFDAYSETFLKIGLNVPVRYFEDWIPKQANKIVEEFVASTSKLDFQVFYDGVELRKPIIFAPKDKRYFIDRFEFEGKHVSAKGYFYVQHGVLEPLELQGVLIRIRNAAVGEFDSRFHEFPRREFQLVQNWVSCELWADDRLEAAMNIDRRTLRDTHPAYVELKEAFHKRLREVLQRAVRDLYGAGSKERKQYKAVEAVRAISTSVGSAIGGRSKATAREIEAVWKKSSTEKKTQKSLLRKYSVSEVYEIVAEIGKDLIPPEKLEELLKRLTKRLGG